MTQPKRKRRTKAEMERARARAASSRKYHLGKTHRMTMEQYEAILAFQGGVCYICQRPPQPGKYLHVDHDHAYAREHCDHDHKESCPQCWRGLVHRHDNDIMALARDSVVLLLRVVDYLQDPPARRMVRDARTGKAGPRNGPTILRRGYEQVVGRGLGDPEDPVRVEGSS